MNPKRFFYQQGKKFLPGFIKSYLRTEFLNNNSLISASPFTLVEDNGKSYVEFILGKTLTATKSANFDFYHIFKDDHVECSSFLELAQDASCFFDVGSSRGVFSNMFCKLAKTNKAYAFEGSPTSCSAIKELSDKNNLSDQINIIEKMVGRHDYQDEFSFEDCGYVQVVSNSPHSRIVRDVISLDSFLERNQITPDLIKIDEEGYEYEVLQGASKLLKDASPTIILELHLAYLESRDINPEKVLKLLEETGYYFYDIQMNPTSSKRLLDTFQNVTHCITQKS